MAVRVLRRHRLAERLLTDVLGMPWDQVQQEACMLEHAISENVEERLIAILGDPKVCPHGLPIPPKDLTDPDRGGIPLAQVDIGSEALVQGVTQEVPEMLRYLGDVGLRPGAHVTVYSKAPLGGPMIVEVEQAPSRDLTRTRAHGRGERTGSGSERFLITRFLVVLNILGFLWELRVGGFGVFSGNIPSGTPIDQGILAPVQVLVGHQYYRIFSAAFLHGSIIHIGVNMLSLFWLGRFIEAALRPFKMALVYFVSLVVSGFSIVYFSPPDTATLGASGAIFGLFGALFAIGLKLGDRGKDLVRSNVGILILNLVWSFSFPGISWQAHVGGLIAGFIFTYLIYTPPRPVMTRVYDPASGVEYQSRVELPDERD